MPAYRFRIMTDKGQILIEYRNSSSGYYGGSLSWPDGAYFYGMFTDGMSQTKSAHSIAGQGLRKG
jgi:hypothetical protein